LEPLVNTPVSPRDENAVVPFNFTVLTFCTVAPE
jgi:hypothetical protein